MKTKYWIILLSVILALCLGLSIPLLYSGQDARYAEIISNGKTVTVVDLGIDQTFSVVTPNGSNSITILDGKIGVTQASCPDHYCMDRGMCSGGTQIVCLPNRLVIRFQGTQAVDSIAG